MVVCVMIFGASPASAASSEFLGSSSDAGITVTGSTGYTLMDGVREGDVTLKKSNGSYVGAHVVLVKANAKASFKPVIPNYYTSGSTKSQRVDKSANWSSWGLNGVTNMVRQYQSAADTSGTVLAAINGDFGVGSKPRGSIIMEGGSEINASAAYQDEFFFGHKSTTGTLNILQRTSSQKSTFDEAICGGAHILRNGELFGVDNETVSRQRTSIGIKTNGDTLLVCVESGITVKQLAQLMRDSGCWNAINMDGGGSITMVTKRSSDSNTVRRTPLCGYDDVDGNGERKICSALMLVADGKVANNVGTVSGNSVTTDKSTYNVGDDIYVTASSASDGSWVSILNADDTADTGSYFWYYTYGNNGSTWCWENGTKNNIYEEGMCTERNGVTASTKLPPGRYRAAILNYNSSGTGYQELASRYFTIKADTSTPYVLSTDKSVYSVGDPILVTATGPSSDSGAWVGLTKSGTVANSSHASYYWYYMSEQGADFNILNGYEISSENLALLGSDEQALIDTSNNQLKPGTYDIVMYTYDGYGIATGADGNPVKKTITVIGQDQEYSITYKDGSTTLSGLSPTSYKISTSQAGAISLPSNVTKTGYNFLGWYTNASFTGSAVTSIPKGSSGDKVYYAKFEKKIYEVTFDTGISQIPVTVAYGDKVTAPIVPARTGYNFDKWVTTSGGSTAFNFSTAIKNDMTVYAKWNPVTYTIQFDTDGGSAVNAISYNIETASFALPVSKKDGHTFLNWKDEASGKTYTSIPKGTTGNMTLKAQWKNSTVFVMEKLDYAYGEDIYITTYFEETGAWVGLYKLGEEPATTTPILKFAVPKSGTVTDITDKTKLDKYTDRPEAWYPQNASCSGELKSGDYIICVMTGSGVTKAAETIHIATSVFETKVTAATCTTDGYTTTYYTDGTEKVSNNVKAFGHDQPENCQVAYTCGTCGETIPAGQHVSGGEADCTNDEVCTVCGFVMTEAFGHDWAEATCTEAKTCRNEGCGKTEGRALGHDWALATCTEAMKCKNCEITEGEPLGHAWMNADCDTPKTCFVCRETDGDELGHQWNEGVVTVEPNCTEDGVRTFTCTVCEKAQKTEKEPATGHAYKDTVVKPTCNSDGYTRHECENAGCGHVYTNQNVPAQHTPGPAATCIKPQTCTKCPAILHGTTDHTPGPAATCTEMQTCTVCNRVLAGAKGHTPGEGPTCTEALTCTTCNEELAPATGHNRGKAATCTKPQTCTDCDYVYKKALGHVPGDAATCTTSQKCVECDAVVTEALGHNPGMEPTCTTSQNCLVCNTVLKSALGHQKEILPGKEATCTAEGLTEGEICKACGEILSAQTAVAKKAHTAAAQQVSAATEKADGEVVHLCACGKELSTEKVYSIKTIKLSAESLVYNGKVRKPSVLIKDREGNLISADYYTVSVPTGRKLVGTYTYKITFKGNYAGEKKLKLTIKPAKPTILAPKAAAKAVTVKWKKVTKQTSGYQVMVATNKKFTQNVKKSFVKSSKSVSKKMTKLKAKKTYYVKVRAYKTVKGVKIYSTWSNVKKIKTR